ncbi:MAG: type IV pilus secretin PilQ [Pseudomonadota bacterium]
MYKVVQQYKHMSNATALALWCRGFYQATLMRSIMAIMGLLIVAVLLDNNAIASQNALKDVAFSTLPGEQFQFILSFETTPSAPNTFSIDNPARIALDFPDTKNETNRRAKEIGIGIARSINIVEAKGRTRVVMNLVRMVGYHTAVVGNDLILTLGDQTVDASKRLSGNKEKHDNTVMSVPPSVVNIDFRRGDSGEGRVLLTLSDSAIPVDLRERGGKIILEITGAELPEKLKRRLDVVDFATPVKTIDTLDQDGKVRVVIEPMGEFNHLAYQADNIFTVEVREVSKVVKEQRKKLIFTGEKLSLNFQDIETRSVLQLIADFTGLNLVVSDTVGGSLTLRLKNVPWDQALDIILKTKGLAMRQTGNVMLIAPSEEIAAREKLELEAHKQVQELAPLHSEFMQINYAQASNIASLLKAPENSLLSGRGAVSIDARTNTLLIQDTTEKLAEIRNIVKRLDIPVRQVLIESRIVIASDNFSKELGVRFGVSNFNNNPAGSGLNSDFVSGNLDATTDAINGDPVELNDSLNVNLPVPNPAGSIGIALAKLPLGTLLELELSAAQAESRAEIISTPRIITSNQTEARIERGVDVPYQEASSSGATSVSFKKAVLSLKVTPQITPDNRVFMDLAVTNDSVGEIFAGVPSIDTRAIETQVLVDNGQTVVLGGIYDQTMNKSTSRVPFFSDIPILGRLFRNDIESNDQGELLIFITPKIIDENLALVR